MLYPGHQLNRLGLLGTVSMTTCQIIITHCYPVKSVFMCIVLLSNVLLCHRCCVLSFWCSLSSFITQQYYSRYRSTRGPLSAYNYCNSTQISCVYAWSQSLLQIPYTFCTMLHTKNRAECQNMHCNTQVYLFLIIRR